MAYRVIETNKKPIPMTDLMIDLINRQARREPAGVEFNNIDNNTTVNDYEVHGGDSNSDLDDDDKSYEISDNSTLNKDHELADNPDQKEEDQQQHFNVPILEVNDINKEDTQTVRRKEWEIKKWTKRMTDPTMYS